MNNFITSRNIQSTIGNRPLKRPAWGSADKYTTLLLLAWSIKPVYHLNFFARSDFLLNFHWLADFFEVKKEESNPTFYCFRTQRVASYGKIRKWKTSFKIMSTKFCKFYPNIHHIPHLTLKLWNYAERTFKCKWPCMTYKSSSCSNPEIGYGNSYFSMFPQL